MVGLNNDSILSEPPKDIPYDHLKEYLEFEEAPFQIQKFRAIFKELNYTFSFWQAYLGV